MELDQEKKALFKKVRTRLGGGVRPVELSDDALCDLLSLSTQDYSEKVLNWIIENNWANLYGKSLTSTDWAFALSTRTLDFVKDYSYWFSKEVGLQQRGPWELKKDYITIEEGKQVYVIPAGREINKVMYMNPPTSQAALLSNYGGLNLGMGSGVFAQFGGGMNGFNSLYVLPMYDVALLAQDLNYRNRMICGDLVYKVTAGPNGTRLLHLMSTPGSKLSFGHSGLVGEIWGVSGWQVWYTYYDISSEEDADECRKANPDVLLSPDQIPLEDMDYAYFNAPTKTIIRQLLTAKAAHTIGLIRGYASGTISIPMAQMQLDYQMFLRMGEEEEQKAMEDLKARLERLNPYEVMKRQAELVQSMIEAKKGVPLGIYVQ